ncbi:MAG: ribosome biogenesis GTPase YqeH [Liquorilactobacillus ghanensis]|jgi:ribosome biogenesis GTPase YqeH|uniref:ribosome biogenesis GTPase YqeH n=1 Tax=Liquorilactobacillus ghanensis TaxID=399370 RepID=UPI0039ED4956
MVAKAQYCIGCGVKLQTTDPQGLGFVPENVLEKSIAAGNNELYCQRCFRLRHYNEMLPVSLTNDDFLQILTKVGQQQALVVNVVDIFDFNGSVLASLPRFVGDNPIILVGNKADLLPKSLKRTKIKEWLRQRAYEIGLHPVAVVLISAAKNLGIDDLLTQINNYRQKRDVCVVGVTNVGKSTLINRLVARSGGNDDLLTVSRFPGTTLDIIKLPLDDGGNLWDTPGIVQTKQLTNRLSPKELKYVQPASELKPKTYQLNSDQTLFLGGLARFDYLSSESKSVVVYLSNRLLIHRTKTANADSFFERHLGGLLQPPFEQNTAEFAHPKRHIFKAEQKSDIVLAGLGWITVSANTTVAIWTAAGVGVSIRKAMI